MGCRWVNPYARYSDYGASMPDILLTQVDHWLSHSISCLGITSKLNRRLTARNRRFWAVNRRLSFEVTPYKFTVLALPSQILPFLCITLERDEPFAHYAWNIHLCFIWSGSSSNKLQYFVSYGYMTFKFTFCLRSPRPKVMPLAVIG